MTVATYATRNGTNVLDTVYYDFLGGDVIEERDGGSLSWINFNPGNILSVSPGYLGSIGEYTASTGFNYSIFASESDGLNAAMGMETAEGWAAGTDALFTSNIDAFIPYSDATPGDLTPSDIVNAANNYLGAAWGSENCTGFVWAVAYDVGAQFFETVDQVATDAGETTQQIVGTGGVIPDPGIDTSFPGYVVPVRSPYGSEFSDTNTTALGAVYAVADPLGSQWLLVNGGTSTGYFTVINNAILDDEPQAGDLFRGVAVNAAAGQCVMHSGIVYSYDASTDVLTLISNWNTPTGVIGTDSFHLISDVSQAVPGGGPYILDTKLALYRLMPSSTDTTPPTVAVDNGLSVAAGGTATITSSDLEATDPDNTASQLIFTITSGPSSGDLLENGSSTIQFTQDDINNNRVSYHETAVGASSDAFSFFLVDPAGLSTSGSFAITVTSSGGGPIVVSSGTTFTVSGGQTFSGITVEHGGALIVSSGGTASATSDAGTEEVYGRDVSGSVIGTDIGGGAAYVGYQNVHSGGVASSTTIASAGEQDVLSGGSAVGAEVLGGGWQVVSAGGTAFNTVNSGTEFISGTVSGTTVLRGQEEIYTGGLAISSTVGTGANQIVSSGGTANGTTVLSGGYQYVYSAGIANGAIVANFGHQEIEGGGIASGTTVSGGGYQDIFGGGTASAAAIGSGSFQNVLGGGIAVGTVITSGATQAVSAGGVASNTLLAGAQVVYGSAVDTIIDSSGYNNVNSGGTTIGTIINSGGSEQVYAGGTDNAIINNGGQQIIEGNGSYGTTTGAIVNSGGKQYIYPFGISSNTILRGGWQYVFGFASATDVAVGTVVSGGGLELVASAGVIIDSEIVGGSIELQTGAVVSGALDFNLTGGGQLRIDGTTMPVATISGFVPGDTFDLANIAFDSAGSVDLGLNNQLQIAEGGTTYDLNLDPSQDFTGDFFHLSDDGSGGTLITESDTPCFCRGTRILTETGEIPVEALAVGDRVETLSGDLKPIRWIGFGRDLVTAKNKLARPIVVTAGALDDGVPRRDLYLTHGHALYFDGVLIPVEHLVNHRTICWDDEARVVEYYHIELEDHDVVFAEGAPAESYYDAGNRALFHNARPRSAPGGARPTFAPVLRQGEIVARVWAALDRRASARLPTATTGDPDLHLVAGGARREPAAMADGVYTFALAKPPDAPVLLCSRSVVPSLVGLSRHEHRRLGVAIRQIVLCGSGVMTVIDAAAPLFAAGGCYAPEGGFCWTDGRLVLPAALFAQMTGPFRLLVQTARLGLRYPLADPLATAA